MIEPGTTKVYVTKYWSTRGIIKVEASVYVSDRGVRYAAASGIFVKIGTDAFESLTDALLKVKKAAKRKAVSAQKIMNRMDAIASGNVPIEIVAGVDYEKVEE
jgi:histidinol phosphatase-like PHP family hydrolase